MTTEDLIRDMHAKRVAKATAADRAGMTVHSFELALEVMGLTWPNARATLVIDGVADTYGGHAARHGLTVWKLRCNVRAGRHPLTPPINGPITEEEVDQFIQMRSEGIAAWRAAETIGRSYNNLHSRANERAGYKKIVANAPRVRRKAAEIAATNQQKERLSSKGKRRDEAA